MLTYINLREVPLSELKYLADLADEAAQYDDARALRAEITHREQGR